MKFYFDFLAAIQENKLAHFSKHYVHTAYGLTFWLRLTS